MNNAQLKAALDDYGDHLEVVVEVEQGDRTRTYRNFSVDTSSPQGEPRIVLLVED